MAWSIVVVLNSNVPLMATVRTIGVVAEEKRRVAVERLATARKPPAGALANSGRNAAAANFTTSGPRQPAAMTRQIASISDVAAAVVGVVVAADTANNGVAPARARTPPMSRPRPISVGSTETAVRARVGEVRAARRLAANTDTNAMMTLAQTTPAAMMRTCATSNPR